MPSDRSTIVRIDAAAACDGLGLSLAPASMLLRVRGKARYGAWSGLAGARLIALGTSTAIDRHPDARNAQRITRLDCVLLPGMVNAHTHLDLTHLGPRPFSPEGGFVAWADIIRSGRRTDEHGIKSSVRMGIERSLLAGVVAVADIAGGVGRRTSTWPLEAMEASPLVGVSYCEYFCIGAQSESQIADTLAAFARRLRQEGSTPPGASLMQWTGRRAVRVGLQPHAPYSVGPAGYAAAMGYARFAGVPVSTHLAESPEEARLLASADGPFRDLLAAVGVWDAKAQSEFGGERPIPRWIRMMGASAGERSGLVAADIRSAAFGGPRIAEIREADLFEEESAAIATESAQLSRLIVAHCNDVAPGEAHQLADVGATVAYCPRSSAYFGHERSFGVHPYRGLLAEGVEVAIGTDSVVNLPASGGKSGKSGPLLSVLDEIRFLHQRDAADPVALLHMATIAGARALGLPTEAFAFGQRLEGDMVVPRAGGESDASSAEVGEGLPIAGVVAVPMSAPTKDERSRTPLEVVLEGTAAAELLAVGTESREGGRAWSVDP
ncbi:MAG: amidohydrolase family protein [Phycisphaerales bacterium]|jgi:cytosine/adenosine deaminase-related metal-dependent hydrolase|nr:amidohydrolase family protein [Phycisphaeraceae bacterium]